ncbi:hypothetical protein PACTADRAFT_51370 [Pachysolen tannophilus NRRL Y-2460]|uniref:inositol phosphorylceramide mannosyltransferase n=1 Tax=Pachysolen tannophilus NRRL Y-2460 TaxID=669874 RepID=A0A1E4TP93_PACTA|nr:hypothetical protein PACTADRAFT_51370 [Pachysolen tannophilus NRRL Y-2460]
MRAEVQYFLLVHLVIVIIAVSQTFDLMTLLYDDSIKDSFTDEELYNSSSSQLQLIPKIIHQTYKTRDIPEVWKAGQQACIDLHPDYQYILWTDEMAMEFIAREYPWFLETFKNYKFPIERADAIRYFVLSHYGGVYIDLDDGCKKRLDPLLTASAFLRKTIPTGISNDLMGSVPKHPFFIKAINNLKKYDRNWLSPYITVMYSTGPLYLSVIWKQYKRWGVDNQFIVKILQPNAYKKSENAFFNISKGSSWHKDDAKFMFLMAHHIPWAIAGGFLLAAIILLMEYSLYRFFVSGKFRYWCCWKQNQYFDLEARGGNNSRGENQDSEELDLLVKTRID